MGRRFVRAPHHLITGQHLRAGTHPILGGPRDARRSITPHACIFSKTLTQKFREVESVYQIEIDFDEQTRASLIG
jgi:hypothetical protein